jgi:hypothetical protein
MQKDYLKRLESNLLKAFTDRKYSDVESMQAEITFNKNGSADFISWPGCGEEGFFCVSDYVPSFWKIENLRLYMRNRPNEKWKLTRYELAYDTDYDFDMVSTLTIYKDLSNDKRGYTIYDIESYKIIDKRNQERLEKEKKSQ